VSLTSFLQEDAREYFKTAFRKPKNPDVSGLPMIPPLAKNPTVVGTAFDYLARWMVRIVNPQVTERDHWVAESAVCRLPAELEERGVEIVQNTQFAVKRS
jgi:hypothetical protein